MFELFVKYLPLLPITKCNSHTDNRQYGISREKNCRKTQTKNIVYKNFVFSIFKCKI